ncbi:uncharacterized protein RHO25_002419 [Cercospora beticola]|uniref:Cyclin N-terminal domain-containing protein n=1 Tax=Cercospora beticola TaxID=122368 RepID=A0ABZ0NE50_CERBT|nr:hypothetical protein RHO25_002419 [Cercospora beticola]
MIARIDNFRGSSEDYVSYLEGLVLSYRSNSAFKANGESVARERTRRRTSDGGGPSTSNHGTRSKHYGTLEFVALDPQSRKLNPVRRKSAISRWKKNAIALVEETPEAKVWYKVLKEEGIYDAMCNGEAAAYLMATDERLPAVPNHEPAPRSVPSLAYDRLKMYALAAVRRGTTASIALKLANFQKFLVLSACYVLHQSGVEWPVLDVVRICVGSDTSQRRAEDILKCARYANELLDALYLEGWGLRACELFLLWNRPLTFFYQLSCASNSSLRVFKESIGTQAFTTLPECYPWTPLFVPKLVQHIIGQDFAIDRISELLGYRHSHLFCANPWQYSGS